VGVGEWFASVDSLVSLLLVPPRRGCCHHGSCFVLCWEGGPRFGGFVNQPPCLLCTPWFLLSLFFSFAVGPKVNLAWGGCGVSCGVCLCEQAASDDFVLLMVLTSICRRQNARPYLCVSAVRCAGLRGLNNSDENRCRSSEDWNGPFHIQARPLSVCYCAKSPFNHATRIGVLDQARESGRVACIEDQFRGPPTRQGTARERERREVERGKRQPRIEVVSHRLRCDTGTALGPFRLATTPAPVAYPLAGQS
jgi:hypothetical protein